MLIEKLRALDFWQAFLLKLVLLYLGLHIAQLYFNESSFGEAVNTSISNFIAQGTVNLMELFSIPSFFEEKMHGAQLYVENERSVYIDHSCNAFNILKAFFALVFAVSTRNKNLLWYIPVGVLSIFLVNIVRVWGLAIVYREAPSWLHINHKYVFTIVVYSWIFGLFLFWVNKYARPQK